MTDEVIVSLPEKVGEYDTLRLSVRHSKAGYGGMDWTLRPGGLKLNFSPCTRTEHGFRSTLMGEKWESGFFMVINDDARKNPHKIKRILSRVQERAEKFAKAYSARDGETLRALADEVKE